MFYRGGANSERTRTRERETDRTATIALRKASGTRKLIFMSEGEEGGGDGVVNPKKGIERDPLSGIGMN